MIEISRVYKAKIEYKLLYSGLRLVNGIDGLSPESKEYELTFCIDRYIDRWKHNNVIKDTYNKLYRFAIAYRHNAIQGTK